MTSFNTVMNMNTKAIAFLLQGCQDDCLITLHDAMSCLRTSLSENDDSMSCSRFYWTTQTIELPDQAPVCNDAFEMFNSAVVFLWQNNQGDSDEEVGDEGIIPAVLLYNMGLCHHRKAIREGSTKVLQIASRCYSHAMSLLETLCDELGDSDMVLLAALANNMAQISSTLFETKNTIGFQRMLDEIIECTDMEYIEEEEAQLFFSMNLLMATELHLHGVAPAA